MFSPTKICDWSINAVLFSYAYDVNKRLLNPSVLLANQKPYSDLEYH